jgi:hypothetical protein
MYLAWISAIVLAISSCDGRWAATAAGGINDAMIAIRQAALIRRHSRLK